MLTPTFVESLKPGSHVKVRPPHSKSTIHQVERVTKSQIIVRDLLYGNARYGTTRFNKETGREVGGTAYYCDYLSEEPVTVEEVREYGKVVLEHTAYHDKTDAREAARAEFKLRVTMALRGRVPADKLRIEASSNDGWATITWAIKIEGLTDTEIREALS